MASNYILPQTQVFQEFVSTASAAAEHRQAFIAGPNFQLVRHSQTAEKGLGLLGAYVPGQETCYAWPNREAGAVVDLNFTKLFIDNALLQYWQGAVSVVDGYKNRVAAAINLKTNGSDLRNAALQNRDAAIGDNVRITDGTNSYESYIAGFVNEIIASSVGTLTNATSNSGKTTKSAAATQTDGDENNVDITSSSANNYSGLADGVTSDTYVIEVVTASINGDAQTAVLRVTSASGKDDVAALIPEAFGSPTAIGTNGLTVTFNNSGGSLGDDFVVGQQWTVTVAQAWDPTGTGDDERFTSGGTYTGPADTTYIVEVTKGGVWADSPEITVRTTTGIDSASAKQVLTADGTITVGNYGITMVGDAGGIGLCKGDIFYIPAVAQSAGAVKTVVLGRNLPAALLEADSLVMTLSIKKDIEVTQLRAGALSVENYTVDTSQLCVKDGITAFDASWTDSNDELESLPVIGGTVYVEYRAFRAGKANAVHSISDPAAIVAEVGTVDVDNPLAMALSKALANSNGVPVCYTAVMGDDVTAYSAALDRLLERNDIYTLVPLSTDRAVQELFASHVSATSTPENGRWRMAVVATPGVSSVGIVTENNDTSPVLATITADTGAPGTPNTIVELDADSTATFAGVVAGDIVRAKYGVDSFGNTVYSAYVVDAKLSDDSVRLVAGPDSPIAIAAKIEIWRNLTADGIAAHVGSLAAAFASRRVINVWPDELEDGALTLPGYHACAAVAGLISGVAPQQGLTNVEIKGFTGVSRTTSLMSVAALNTMAAAGVFIITQSPTGTIYCRHELTTDMSDVYHREVMVTKNVDSVSYQILDAFAPYTGRSNITPELINVLTVELQSLVTQWTAAAIPRLGAQVTSLKIKSLAQHPVLKDRLVAVLDTEFPLPMNNLEMHLVI